jgi:pilus assembly protein CpaB
MPRFRRPRSPVHVARQLAAAVLTVLALALALRPAPAPAAPDRAATVKVVVSARDLPPGTVLTASDLATAAYPADAAPTGVVGDPRHLLHRVLAGGVRAKEPLTDARLVGPGVTALLPTGQVAAPVRLADLGMAALVHTGDRVDVLATVADAPSAEVIADGALVVATTGADEQAGAGLLLLAVDQQTAARLAAAAASATLTVTLPPP